MQKVFPIRNASVQNCILLTYLLLFLFALKIWKGKGNVIKISNISHFIVSQIFTSFHQFITVRESIWYTILCKNKWRIFLFLFFRLEEITSTVVWIYMHAIIRRIYCITLVQNKWGKPFQKHYVCKEIWHLYVCTYVCMKRL